ncbi:hypothetical protein EV215_1286 [Hypnocyclicus thermotrophus]|uniref:DUF4013 domain-containing protein n=1 Tax=Hypnocyclicus thermotrophus TaxID=1627895 RepID=A0AA46I5H1_9FUSO|nr:hypothetical protein [Hypnocyclicus thermotrophus]TDT69751.1 hypothetical protein EV215_1286 [Hypnocyclicus thermotrophus]
MLTKYEEAFAFFNRNKNILYSALFFNFIISFLVIDLRLSIMGYFLFFMFSIGLISIVKNETRLSKINIKRIFLYSLIYYPKIFQNLIEAILIIVINISLLSVLTILPMYGIGILKNDIFTFFAIIFLLLIVLVYRIPLIVYSFITSIIIPKEFGKYAIVKIKEIIKREKGSYNALVKQLLIFLMLSYLIFISKNILSSYILKYILNFLILFFLVRNYYWYYTIVNATGEYKKIYDENTYNGMYSSTLGRFFM